MSAQGFVDPYNFQPYSGQVGMSADTKQGDGTVLTGSSVWEKIGTWLGLEPDHKAEYERMLAQEDREYERQSVNSARAWDEYMDSTKIQRLTKDIEAAGLNPWLAIQSGLSAGGAAANTATAGGSARSRSSKQSGKSGLSDIAMFMVATAKLLTMLA